MEKSNHSLLIIGCGYLGEVVARSAVSVYQSISALVRSNDRINRLKSLGLIPTVVDINDPKAHFREAIPSTRFDVIFMVPPSGLTDHREVMERTVLALEDSHRDRALLISSTGVYGGVDGIVVKPETPPSPNDARSRRLYEIEQAWLAGGESYSVLRLAGIYGQGRVIGKASLEAGHPIPGDPEAWLNLIHVEDAASLTQRCLTVRSREIELGSDGSPVKRRDYYGHLAGLLGANTPHFAGTATRNVVNRRCDPKSTFQHLRWLPRFDNFRDGLEQSLKINIG